MNMKKIQWTKRLNFAMLSAWLLMSVILAVIAFVWFGVDFRGSYAAARVFAAGANPYDYDLVAQVLLEVTGEMGNNPYYYPPWFAWLFVPLIALPFQVARAVWMILNVAVWMFGLWQLGRLVAWPLIRWQRYALFMLTTFSFAWITWRYEQAGILVFAILIALILSIQRHDWVWSGVWLALLLVKPNVTFIVAAGIILWLFCRGARQAVSVMFLTLIVLLSVSTLITPDWFQPFFEDGFGQGLTVALDGPDRVVAVRINTTFPDWLRTLGIENPIRVLFYGVAISAGIVVFLGIIYRSESFLELVSILLLLSYALTPYALQYDYPPLAIVLFWALAQSASSSRTLAVGLGMAGFVFSVIFWQQNISWAYWMVVGLIALTIWGWLHKQALSEPK